MGVYPDFVPCLTFVEVFQQQGHWGPSLMRLVQCARTSLEKPLADFKDLQEPSLGFLLLNQHSTIVALPSFSSPSTRPAAITANAALLERYLPRAPPALGNSTHPQTRSQGPHALPSAGHKVP